MTTREQNCPQCGAQNDASARFCDRCGERLQTCEVRSQRILSGVPSFWARSRRTAGRGDSSLGSETSTRKPRIQVGTGLIIIALLTAMGVQAVSNGRNYSGVVGAAGLPSANALAVAQSSTPASPAELLPVGYRVGDRAPDFSLVNIDGRTVSLGGLRGHPVIINFWASWCTYCRVEMPELDALYKEESARHGLIVLAVNTLDSDRLSAESLIVTRGFSFTVLWDENNRVGTMYDVRSLPASFFIDRTGIIRAYSPGAMSRDDMRDKAGLIY